jgi:DNA-binding MarR family transcriptional regulator
VVAKQKKSASNGKKAQGGGLKLSKVSRFKSSYDVLGYLLRLMSQIWHRHLNAELAKIDLTEMQFVLMIGLAWLSETRSDGVSQKELAEDCGCSTALASQVLQKLVSKKLVEVKFDPNDARVRVVRLSAKGEKRIQKAVKILERADEDFRSDDPVVSQNLFDALKAAIAVKLATTSEPGHDLGAMPVNGLLVKR